MKKTGPHLKTPLIISLFLTILLLVAIPAAALATDYYVKTSANGGNDSNSGADWANAKATITAAMALANGSDTIHVAAGTYSGTVNFPEANSIQLLGGYMAIGGGTQAPWSNTTIIDGGSPVISIPWNGGSRSYTGLVIDGFTVKNGTKSAAGAAGIESYSAGITIKRCIIENNTVTGNYGTGGIYVFSPYLDSSLAFFKMQDCIIRNNSGPGTGGVLFDSNGYSQGELTNCLIYGNSATDSTTDGSYHIYTTGGIAVGGGGYEIASFKIINCTIANNTSVHPVSVGGITINTDTYSGAVEISNCIIWHDSLDDLYVPFGSPFSVSYSDIEDTVDAGTGVIHTNPAFAGTSDFHLTSGSGGCIDGGTASGAPSTDLDGNARPEGSGYDMGAYEYSAAAAPDISVSQLTVAFGDVTVGESADAIVTITNDGSENLNLGTITDPAAPFTLVEACSGQTLAPGATCDCNLTFTPTATESSTGSFTIPSDDPDENPVTIQLSGTGIPAPEPDITVTDNKGTTNDLDVPFGNLTIGESANATVTITNDGNADLDLGAITGLEAPFSILESCSSSTLVSGATCDCAVAFAPTASGAFSDTLSIPSNDPDENPVTVTVSGNGITPVVQYTLTTTVDPTGGGTIALDPAGGTYDEGTSVSLTGTANTGYIFDGWNGDVSDSDASTTTTTMSADKTVTAIFMADDDSDGIPSEVEYGPDGTDATYDGDSSGSPDSQEGNVVSGSTYDDAYYVTLAVPGTQSLADVNSSDNPSSEDSPSDITFPYGFFEFTITGVGAGNSTTATIYLPDGEEPTTYWKYGPTPTDGTDHWYEFLYDGTTGAEFNGNVITLHFVDGERGDDDLAANGVVVDIGAPGEDAPAGDSDSNSNCFISTMIF